MDKKTVSICMIVKDEELNLERCLDSALPLIVEPWVELIVVDTGSTDRTVEVAERHFAKVYRKEFVPWNFSDARNYGIGKAVGDWIFILDADEEIPQSCIYDLKALLYEPGDEPTKFLHLRNIFSQDNQSYSNMIQPRIFKHDPDFKYDGSVHNKPTAKGPFFFCSRNIFLNHYGYKFENNQDLAQKKYDRSLPLLIEELEKNPKDTHILTHLIKTYRIMGEYDKVIDYSERWANEMDAVDYHEGWFAYNEVWIDLVDAYLRFDRLDDALATYKRSKKFTDRLPDLELLMGSYYSSKMRDADTAKDYYEKAMQICTTPGSPYEQLLTSNAEVTAPRLYNWMALYYYHKGDWERAGDMLNKGVLLNNPMFKLRWDVFNAIRDIPLPDKCPFCQQDIPEDIRSVKDGPPSRE